MSTRSDTIQRFLEDRRLDGLLLNLPENILFGSGYWPSTAAALFIPVSGRPTLVIPKPDLTFVPQDWKGEVRAYDTRLEDDPTDLYIAKLLQGTATNGGGSRRQIGCDRSMQTIAGTHIGGEARVPGAPFYALLEKHLPASDFVDVTPWVYEARMLKTVEEIAALRRTAQVVDHALEVARGRMVPGMKETELSAIIEGEIQAYGVGYDGARRARGFAFAMSGPENTAGAWAAYNISTDRKIREGDLVLIELDSQVEGYWSDLSRTWVAGRASERQREVWSAVHEAQQRAVEAVRVGSRISQIDGIARDALTARGYGREFLHHIGHGVGFSFHEVPYLDPASRVPSDWEIAPRMVFAIEPGVYIDGWGGVRIEDNVTVNEAGRAEYLSTANRGL